MQATIITNPGNTWTLMVDIPAFAEDMGELIRAGVKEATRNYYEKAIKEAVEEAQILTSLQAAALMGYTTTDKVHEYAELDKKDPEHLKCIWHEDKRYRRFRLSAIIEWAEAHEDESILQRARNFRYKPKRKKSTKPS